MPLITFGSNTPSVDSTAFIAPDAWIIGQVVVGARTSVFFNAVLRGDLEPITVGSGSNIQEHCLIHTTHGMDPVTVGDNVTIGHRAIIHGCTIGNGCLIGMGATILDNARIGDNCIIGAHSLVVKGTQIPDRSLVMGTPAKVIRPLTDDELRSNREASESYQRLGAQYAAILSCNNKPLGVSSK
jgi:carbonic anhydrase/acetyltransferase-like protein (isoleucine patch superfamily)